MGNGKQRLWILLVPCSKWLLTVERNSCSSVIQRSFITQGGEKHCEAMYFKSNHVMTDTFEQVCCNIWNVKSNYLKCIASHCLSPRALCVIRELKQPRRRRQQKPHKFAYLTMKNSIFARFARAFFIFWHFEDVLVLSTTWNDLFCSCVDDVSIWWQMFNFVFLCPTRLFQFNSRTVITHFSSITTLNN